MEITAIQVKTKQGVNGSYDAMIIKFNDMHFSKDLLGGLCGDRDLSRLKRLAHSLGIEIDCYDQRLKEWLARV